MDDSVVEKNLKKVFPNVSRETCIDLEKYIDLIIQENNVINLISRANVSKEYILNRHIIDSMQIVDFVDFNQKKIIDFGSGSGFPGIILAIVAKFKGSETKIVMYEKSYRKCQFLKKTSATLKLKTEIIQKNIYSEKDKSEMTITSRAFKPLPVILDIAEKNFQNYKNIILFMGKSGKKILKETLCDWDLSYEIKDSITNKESFILNIMSAKRV